MNVLLRLATCSGALALAICGLETTNPDWLSQVGPAFSAVHQLRSQLDRERKEEERLCALSKIVLESNERKDQLVADLIADRITLWEAAAQFRQLSQAMPADHQEVRRRVYPSHSDEECFCREVIAAIQAQYLNEPNAVAPLVAHLTRELDEALACYGHPVLPEPPVLAEQTSTPR